jgi:hypothetical protein
VREKNAGEEATEERETGRDEHACYHVRALLIVIMLLYCSMEMGEGLKYGHASLNDGDTFREMRR